MICRAQDSEEPKDKGLSMKTWGWIAVGTGGVILLSGAITGALALDLNGDLEDAGCTSSPGCDGSSHKDDQKTHTLDVYFTRF